MHEPDGPEQRETARIELAELLDTYDADCDMADTMNDAAWCEERS